MKSTRINMQSPPNHISKSKRVKMEDSTTANLDNSSSFETTSSSKSSSPNLNVTTTIIGGKDTQIIIKDHVSTPTTNKSANSPKSQTADSHQLNTYHSQTITEESNYSSNQIETATNLADEVYESNPNNTESTQSTVVSKAVKKSDKKKRSENDDTDWCKVANKEFKKSLEKNLNPVSFTGMNKLTSVSNGYHGSELEKQLGLERVMDISLYCPHCKQLNDFCHFKVYSDYIEKKLFYKYTSKTEYPGDPVIYKDCVEAYNEKRRVIFHDKFEFYDGAEIDLPYCLVKHAYDIETMIQSIVRATNINNNIRKGVVQCIRAKRSRRA